MFNFGYKVGTLALSTSPMRRMAASMAAGPVRRAGMLAIAAAVSMLAAVVSASSGAPAQVPNPNGECTSTASAHAAQDALPNERRLTTVLSPLSLYACAQ